MRTRFAPSPTGALHVGNARVAVFNWLLTRRREGTFILRIEDTDLERTVPGSEEQICADLHWLGLDWDEGPAYAGAPSPGPHAPYRQSERLAQYREQAQHLLIRGNLYPCYCTPSELEAMRREARAHALPYHYNGHCRDLTGAQRAAFEAEGRVPALRFRVPEDREVEFRDAVRGVIRVHTRELGDFIVQRPDGLPTYNFAVVVDDIAMEITHVIRGAGHLSNTPRQVLVFQALGAELPVFAHVPTVLGPDRQKLSKRHGARSIADYRREGYHADAVVNYLSLLSWSSPTGEEFLDREQLVEAVSLDRVGAADVIFDPAKLRWLSSKHIEAMPLERLVPAVLPFIDHTRYAIPDELVSLAVDAVRTHLATFSDINEALAAYFPATDGTLAAPAEDAAGVAVIDAALSGLEQLATWDEATVSQAVKQIGRQTGTRGRALYEPLRRALTGRDHGPPFVALLLVQGRAAVLDRLTRRARQVDGHG